MSNTEQNLPLVLVVDDQPTMRFFAREILTRAGFRVIEAENGRLALESFVEQTPDFILLDVMMPELDGFAACETIRSMPQGAHVPVLMMTGMDDEHSIVRAYDAGATDFINKPINRVVLPHRVRYMLRAKETADSLRESEALLADAQRLAKLGNWHWHPQRGQIRYSDVCRLVLGMDSDGGQLSNGYESLFAAVPEPDRSRLLRAIDSARRGGVVSLEHQVVVGGRERTVYHAVEGVADAAGEVVRLVGTVQDITERKKSEQRIRSLAYRDQLTGLCNRTYLKEFLNASLERARRNNDIMALLYLDLDHFKRVNDTLGHNAGDELLREVAARLRRCIRGDDGIARPLAEELPLAPAEEVSHSIARLGGDEFIIVLSQLNDPADAMHVAQRVIDLLTRPISLEGQEVFVTTSVGITVYPNDGDNEETLLKNADVAMYHAKERGRNNYQFFKESLNATIAKRLALESSLRRAIEHGEFTLRYQPKLDLASNRVTGMEALLRWQKNGQALTSPDDFVPFAEETGLIVPIGEWVLRTACEQNKAWQQSGIGPLRVAVNLSARQFKEDNLVEQIRDTLALSGLEPQFLELEITEGMLMEDVNSARTVLQELKAMGVVISVDDFGTGYSSLSYLKRFPIDILKIDRSFIKDLCCDSDSRAIVQAIISMAHSLNLKVVAEGVETQEQMLLLRGYGCDEVQGYAYSPPVAVADLADLLQGESRWRRLALASA